MSRAAQVTIQITLTHLSNSEKLEVASDTSAELQASYGLASLSADAEAHADDMINSHLKTSSKEVKISAFDGPKITNLFTSAVAGAATPATKGAKSATTLDQLKETIETAIASKLNSETDTNISDYAQPVGVFV
jgi:hypothetical protein